MLEFELQEHLIQHLICLAEYGECRNTFPFNGDIKDVRSFKDIGLLTDNKGLVINLTDGSQFQLQITKTR